MAGHPVDALQCFTFLIDNVPCWISRVTELAAHTSRKHAEFSEEFHRLARSQPQQSPRRRENSSSSSVHTKPAPSKQSGDEVRPIRPLVIYYDSHTQAQLEQTVRDIGAARNSLRKGKMSQTTRIASLSLDMFTTSQSRDSPHPMVESYRRTRPVETDQKETATFEFAEKQLEIAQSLSEFAAHQFLRCGDCREELEEIIAKFSTVLEMAGNEASRLRAEREERQRTDGSLSLKEHIAASSLQVSDLFNDDKAFEPGIAAIEVDDAASASSISIDIAAFRSNRFRG
ncbi:hypothetical protein UA08_06531 [Talaromyces atroroseus]|uniref:Uncharacterized protein n=1 Tax=Talaromyces atroroseus TaxID=1441469 RepID=A0A225AB23_TALAT|nr:hypothetical protein UA08_06531 [Talaromyces atroroseus]OKL58221.1 hypothetical protein UA08_06531 [Talaromyces atroroseus]